MKNVCFLIILFVVYPFLLVAQQTLYCPPIDASGKVSRIDITAGVGPTLLYGDIDNFSSNTGIGFVLKGDYNFYKGLYVGLEGQIGRLSVTGNNDPRFVRNNYLAGSLHLTVYPYRMFVTERELLTKSSVHQFILHGLYVGVGIGGILNRYEDVYRVDDSVPSSGIFNGPHIINEDGEKEWLSSARDVLFPVVNVGLAVPFNKYSSRSRGYFSGVGNLQFSFSQGEDLDGYDPRLPDGSRLPDWRNDMYLFSYLGLRYSF